VGLIILSASAVGANDSYAVQNLQTACVAAKRGAGTACAALIKEVQDNPTFSSDQKTATKIIEHLAAEAVLHPTWVGGFVTVTLTASKVAPDVFADLKNPAYSVKERAWAAKDFISKSEPKTFEDQVKNRKGFAANLLDVLAEASK